MAASLTISRFLSPAAISFSTTTTKLSLKSLSSKLSISTLSEPPPPPFKTHFLFHQNNPNLRHNLRRRQASRRNSLILRLRGRTKNNYNFLPNRRKKGHPIRRPARFHSNLFPKTPSRVRRKIRGTESQRGRDHRLRIGERRVCDAGVEREPGD
ncbi:hypothetical protein CRYUN_Cryun08bG0131700 [Craigia yunnanensis]